MTVGLLATLVVLGFAGAFLSGLVGVGGAIVMIPLLLYVPPLLDVGRLDVRTVAAVSMAQVLAATVVGAWAHWGQTPWHRPLAATGGVAMASAALLGGLASGFVAGRILLAVFALMATVALPLLFLRPIPADRARIGDSDLRMGRAGILALPGAIGLMSGLVGAGGAFLLMPVLVGVMRIPVRVAIGTSLAMTALSAASGFLGKLVTGQVPFWPALAVVAGSLAGAPLGARLSGRAPVIFLRGVLTAVVAATVVRVWMDVFSR